MTELPDFMKEDPECFDTEDSDFNYMDNFLSEVPKELYKETIKIAQKKMSGHGYNPFVVSNLIYIEDFRNKGMQ